MIDKTPIPGLELNSTEAKTQINNFWNYLDELAAKNPEEYKKFIAAQMKKGVSMAQEIRKEKEEKNNQNIEKLNNIANQNIQIKKIFEVYPYLSLRFKPLKILKNDFETDEIEKNNIFFNDNKGKEIIENPTIKFGNEFQDDAFSSKVIQNRKIYLNIIYSDDYYKPTDEHGNFLSNEKVSDENNWKYIPTEFRYDGKNNSMSGTRCDYYDVIISSIVVFKMKKNEQMYKSLLGYITRKFVIFTNDKFILFTGSVKIVQEKLYKSINSKPEIFKSKLGENHISTKKINNNTNNTNLNNNNKLNNNNNDNLNNNNYLSNNNSNLNSNTIITNENEITRKENDQNEINENNIIIPSSSNLKNEKGKDIINEGKQEKKILIQEIESESNNKQMIPLKKKIIDQTHMEVKFFFDEFDYLKGLNEIDLQISEHGIIIHLDNPHYIIDKNYEPVEMKFDFKVNPDNCKAKYNKKEKILTVIIERII